MVVSFRIRISRGGGVCTSGVPGGSEVVGDGSADLYDLSACEEG